jgi:hypothetical protein
MHDVPFTSLRKILARECRLRSYEIHQKDGIPKCKRYRCREQMIRQIQNHERHAYREQKIREKHVLEKGSDRVAKTGSGAHLRHWTFLIFNFTFRRIPPKENEDECFPRAIELRMAALAPVAHAFVDCLCPASSFCLAFHPLVPYIS